MLYAFNGTGKTRLSREFKELIAPQTDSADEDASSSLSRDKILYYNAFTEDLFYWAVDAQGDAEPKLKIQPNAFTDWVLREQGQDFNIIANFQRYAAHALTPKFNVDFSEVTFSLERGTDERLDNLKVSKGEESIFIWSIFHTLLDVVVGTLNVPELEERDTNQFDQLEYVFIDDPVSSLDENHLIELAVNLAELIRASQSSLQFIVSTHSIVFYNILHNELGLKDRRKKDGCYLLERSEDGSFNLNTKYGDSNRSFSYHLFLKQILEEAIASNSVRRYHFTLLRNLYEKSASFLGYRSWSDLLPDDKTTYLNRVIQFSSHSTLSNEEPAEPSGPEKQTVAFLLNHLLKNYGFWQEEASAGEQQA